MHAQAKTVLINDAPTKHQKLLAWVEQVAALTKPDRIYWCDGSNEEYDRLCAELVATGTFRKLNDTLRPNSYLALFCPNNCRYSRTRFKFISRSCPTKKT